MPRFIQLLIGPELFWCLVVGAALLLAQANVPPSKSVENIIENLHLWISCAGILTFSLWFIPGVNRDWLLLRIWIAAIIGAHFALDKALSAHSEQSPGIGTVYIAGMMFQFFVLLVGSVVVKVFYA
ncbi:hypothetical protein G8759_17990 [Spirosoma aureum]|uniref:Uncharacterized protein n=1 Tax=Spirosoma aureum TaxID=2692134 RepID=A0A6G9APF3_9BACT|nr:hypothetical protein [Spirosoma aureum]QIP14372.1 hypothetical protein G8759_17990 [Spirosoma aureum]